MLRTLDIVLIGVMTVAATITYTIKHHAELKLEEVRRLEAEIRLEKDTIDLLKADWALLTQPSRLERMVRLYQRELHLAPTASVQIVQPQELPKRKDELTIEEIEAAELAREAALKAETLVEGEAIQDVEAVAAQAKAKDAAAKAAKKKTVPEGTDQIETGSVNR